MGNVEEDHAFSLILRQIAKLKNGEKLKLGISIDQINKKNPLLSHTAFLMLSERADPSFIVAVDSKKAESISKWAAHYYGKKAKVAIVEPEPKSTHGIRKLKLGHHILIDDSPQVSAAMKHELAKGKALLLIGKRKEAVRNRNPKNTAIVASAEHAADLIFEAHELQNGR